MNVLRKEEKDGRIKGVDYFCGDEGTQFRHIEGRAAGHHACEWRIHDGSGSVWIDFRRAFSGSDSSDFNEKFSLTWTHKTDAHTLASWTVSNEVVEYGAVGLALLIMMELTPFHIFEKGQLKTGIDFWLGKGQINRQTLPLFLRQARLEITGIEKETKYNNLKMRIRDKVKQVGKTDYTGLPVYIVTIEFNEPQSKIIVK